MVNNNSNSNCSNPNTTRAYQKFNAHSRNKKWKQRKDNEKREQNNGDDGGVAFARENDGGGAYLGACVRERMSACVFPP